MRRLSRETIKHFALFLPHPFFPFFRAYAAEPDPQKDRFLLVISGPDRITDGMSDVTRLLSNLAAGDADSMNRLYEQVYAELRAIALQKMASERPGHTLQPTALVHEAFLRLGGGDQLKFDNRAHFFAAAAEAMRRILVESARRHGRLKRGGDQERVEWCEDLVAAPVESEKLLLVDEALDILAREDPMQAEVAKMRYFVGLKHQEIADALGVSESTIRNHWAVAKVRLFELMSPQSAPSRAPSGETP
jgi:RNA polymerase sigma factor (TIGR02999 family)